MVAYKYGMQCMSVALQNGNFLTARINTNKCTLKCVQVVSGRRQRAGDSESEGDVDHYLCDGPSDTDNDSDNDNNNNNSTINANHNTSAASHHRYRDIFACDSDNAYGIHTRNNGGLRDWM